MDLEGYTMDYRIKKNKNIDFGKVGKVGMLFCYDNMVYYEINETGSFIFEKINNQRRLSSLIKICKEKFKKTDSKIVEKNVKNFLSGLKKEKIIEFK